MEEILGSVLIALELIRVILAGRATIGIAALLGDIPPKSHLYWIKPLIILWLFTAAVAVGVEIVLTLVVGAEKSVALLSNIILLAFFIWLALKGSKDEVKEKMKAAGFSYNKTNWGLIGVHFFIFSLWPALLLTFYSLSAFFADLSP